MLAELRHGHLINQVGLSSFPVSIASITSPYLRYFVTEVLETIAPPYSLEFVNVFLPLVENEEITGSMRQNDMDSDPVSEFIVHCKALHGINSHSL